MPFVAEEIYQSFRIIKSEDSVHLEKWPEIINKDAKFDIILQDMREVRNIASLGLEARAKAGIKVRQPLALLKVNRIKSNIENDKQLQQLILDEVNVKKIIFDKNITNEVELDVRLTPELIEEGIVRELTRNIQDLRKKAGLVPQDKITLTIETDSAGEKLIKKFKEEIKYSTSTTKIEFSEVAGEQIKIDELVFKTRITK
jgi:isoleucyl-tRNA synthetase